jgi:phosphohistidine phosphatase
MLLVFIRHGIAAPLGGRVKRDRDRPLTARGAEVFAQVAEGLARVVPQPQAILTSPLLRARQTADIAARTWGGPRPQIERALTDGDWPRLRRALAGHGKDATVALVGHENWISEITARLLRSTSAPAFRYRKGGVAAIEVSDMKLARGRLRWFIPPKVWRRV